MQRRPLSPPGAYTPGQAAWAAAGLAIATLVVYWPATRGEFIRFDDPAYVTENMHVAQGLTWNNVAWAFTSREAGNWHPLTWLSHLLDASLYGTQPQSAWGHHLTSILFHAANSGLLLFVLWLMTGRLWPSALVAAIFAWHPLRVESVAWVAERKDVLSGFWFMLTLGAYTAYTRRPGWRRYLLVVLALSAGLASKQMLVTVPFLLLLLDFWPLDRWPRERPIDWQAITPLVREKLPLVALVTAASLATLVAQGRGGAMATSTQVPWNFRLANACVAAVVYLKKFFWPDDLAVFYPYRGWRLHDPGVWLAVAILLAITTAVVVAARRRGQLLGFLPVGWFWYLGMLVPVLGLVQVGSQSLADRYTYLPMIGVTIVIVWTSVLIAEWRPVPRWSRIAAAVVLLGACIVATRSQLSHWQNSRALFEHALTVTENNSVALANLANVLMRQGIAEGRRAPVEQAVEHYRESIAMFDISSSRDGLASAAVALGDYPLALEQWRTILRKLPDELHAQNNLAWLLATCPDESIRRPDEAVRLAEDVCQRTSHEQPDYLDTLAVAYAAAGRFDDARRTIDLAIARWQLHGVPVPHAALAHRQGFHEQRAVIDSPPLK